QWSTPFGSGALSQSVAVGAGRVVALGLYCAEAYYAGERRGDERYGAAASDFERFVRDVVASAGVNTPVGVIEAKPDEPLIHLRWGLSGRVPVLFVINEEPRRAVTLQLTGEWARAADHGLRDLIANTTFVAGAASAPEPTDAVTIALPPSPWGVHVLVPAE
ncbi:MAG: hypothetical protein EA382_00280, partial [Spirochaetaceae bacterium]